MSSASQEQTREQRPTSAAEWHRRGNALIEEGRIDRAISAYRKALRIDDSLAEAHNDLGTAYFEKQWLEQAEQCFRRAIGLKPDHGVAHANLGATLRAQGRLSEGRQAYQRALLLKIRGALPGFLRWAIEPPAAVVRQEVGNALKPVRLALSQRDLVKARTIALEAEKRFPDEPEVLHLLGAVLDRLDEPKEALSKVRAAVQAAPDRGEFRRSLAKLYLRTGDKAAALEAASASLRLEPDSAPGYATLSAVHREAYRLELAEQAARRAVEIDPELAAGHDALAMALWRLERLEQAIPAAREAVRLAPGETAYRLNLGVVLKDAGEMQEAADVYRVIAKAQFHDADFALNLGAMALNCLADLDAARAWLARAAARGDRPEAVLSAAVVDLLEGRLEPGWEKAEARREVEGHRERHAEFRDLPRWDGRALEAERLLVYGEQGVGDEILFASMLPDLARRVRRITLVCDPRAAPLFARSFPGIEVLAAPPQWKVANRERFAFAVGAGSLALHFRRTAADFPGHRGYLVPHENLVHEWRERLAALGTGMKVGISWFGGTQKTGRYRRSMRLEQLRPVLETPGIDWVSVQHGAFGQEIAELEAAAHVRVHSFPGVTKDMDQLAAITKALDVVVSICNTTVHVAGAVGAPVLVMAPVVPLWAYGLRGERMPWYPSVRVIRQQRYGDWSNVLQGVAEALRERAAAPN